MKAFMMLGAVVGFLIGAGFSLVGNCPWPTVLWRACVAALFAGLLARWWSRIWVEGLQSAIDQRRRQRMAPKPESKPVAKL